MLPPLRENGYKSENINHDLLVNALHLGGWLRSNPINVELYTEQQLRRIQPEFYPPWVPLSTLHRPDGYWFIKNSNSPSSPNQQRLIALEVEISRKPAASYLTLSEFYGSRSKIERAIWLVPTESMATGIHKQLERCQTDGASRHSYITVREFFENGWQTKITYGQDEGITVAQILGVQSGCKDGAKSVQGGCMCTALLQLHAKRKTYLTIS